MPTTTYNCWSPLPNWTYLIGLMLWMELMASFIDGSQFWMLQFDTSDGENDWAAFMDSGIDALGLQNKNSVVF